MSQCWPGRPQQQRRSQSPSQAEGMAANWHQTQIELSHLMCSSYIPISECLHYDPRVHQLRQNTHTHTHAYVRIYIVYWIFYLRLIKSVWNWLCDANYAGGLDDKWHFSEKETTVELFLIKGSSLEEMQISTVTGQRGHTDSSLNWKYPLKQALCV